MSERPEIAFVVQRYGAEVAGGSESLARALAERMAPDYGVTVFTTCARDYVTWRNELRPGESREGEVTVRRFPSEEERDLQSFNRCSDALYARPHRRDDEIDWLRRQGPFVPRLVDALREEKSRFHAVVFFTYLYYPTYWGLRAAPERALLVPTTHDEPPLRLEIFRDVFALPRALAFLTPPEEALVRSRFEVAGRPADVTGIGVDLPERPPAVAEFRARHALSGPYAVYAGRIDAGKGCAEMIAAFAAYRSRGGAAGLALMGRLAMDLPRVPGLRYLGYLPEDEKQAALAGAEAVVCSSPYESLSIVLLEAFAVGTPGLANAASPVLKDHCLRSNGGLYYASADEFVAALDLMVTNAALRRALGEAGRRYVAGNYRWDAVLARYRALIEAAARG